MRHAAKMPAGPRRPRRHTGRGPELMREGVGAARLRTGVDEVCGGRGRRAPPERGNGGDHARGGARPAPDAPPGGGAAACPVRGGAGRMRSRDAWREGAGDAHPGSRPCAPACVMLAGRLRPGRPAPPPAVGRSARMRGDRPPAMAASAARGRLADRPALRQMPFARAAAPAGAALAAARRVCAVQDGHGGRILDVTIQGLTR